MQEIISNRNQEKINTKTPFVLWFTGLSGAGKSTLSDKIYEYFAQKNLRVERLDGDSVREIFPNIGFSREERNEHVKRMAFIASMLERNNIIVIASFISPYNESREFARKLCNNYIEVFVSASIDECKKRDVKGLYKKAKNGEIKNFTGIDDPYEIPRNPELVINTEKFSESECIRQILDYIKNYSGVKMNQENIED